MNFSQKIGLFCLILITAAYIYFSFFQKMDFSNRIGNPSIENSKQQENVIDNNKQANIEKHIVKTVKIYVTDSNGNLRSVSRKCDTNLEKSCFAYAIKELIAAPSDWEKKKGLSSEIPSATKILSIREDSDNVLVDLSTAFESGGGAESTYIRVHQLIKTVLSNTKLPVYLYIDGKQANVIGGEGIMIKQPLSERSLDD